MYRKFSVKNFRGILSAEISQLSRINLVVGENGSGKSALLEALWLHANPSITTLSQVHSFRQLSWVPVNGVGGPEVPWRHLFHELSDPISFSGITDTADWTYSISQKGRYLRRIPPPLLHFNQCLRRPCRCQTRSVRPP